MFFYYVRDQLDEYQPRVSREWPPIGAEVNEVHFKKGISAEEANLTLAELSKKYPMGASND